MSKNKKSKIVNSEITEKENLSAISDSTNEVVETNQYVETQEIKKETAEKVKETKDKKTEDKKNQKK